MFRTVNSTTIGAVTRIHTVNRGWKDRSGERKTDFFSPEQTNNFILTTLITHGGSNGGSGKRARRRQKAQESLEREASHSNPGKRTKPDSDPEEEEEDCVHAIVAGESSGSSRL